MSRPLVSVVITCFNRQLYLKEAIDSALRQSFTDREIILVDDGSTDGSARIAAGYGTTLRYHHQENQGASAAKNTGAALARGKYLAFLDSDDLWTRDKLAVQAAYAAEHPQVAILYAHGQQFLSPELTDLERAGLHCPSEPMPAPTSGTLFTGLKNFQRVDGFRPDLRVGIDVEWNLRARSMGLAMATLPEVLLHRRIHPGNSGLIHKTQARQHVRIVKDHLDRLRRGKPHGRLNDG